MRKLDSEQSKAAQPWLDAAAEAAKQSSCARAKCGSVIVSQGQIIGQGYNSPAGNEPARCTTDYQIPSNNRHDLTCCVHAEIRAINDALTHHPEALSDSTLYFVRLGEDREPKPAGHPYCTMCSRAALDTGLAEFALWHKDGLTVYNTQEYNDLSYQFYKDQSLWNSK